MIADFGLSKQLSVEVTSNSKAYGMPAYFEPQYYKKENYVRDKRSDIYSLGVLLWEITSGRPPFSETPAHILIYKVANGHREEPIINTPSAYINLYQKCWDDDPDLRPNIDDVFDILLLKETPSQLNDDDERDLIIIEPDDKIDSGTNPLSSSLESQSS